MNKVKYIAHRGYSFKDTENTINAFKSALEEEFYGVELDVHLTKDKVVVVHHDNDTERLGNINLKISDVLYKELKKVKLRNINNNIYELKIPKLEDILKLVNEYNKYSFVEIKQKLNKEDLKIIHNIIKEFNKVIIISFHLENLLILRKIVKKINMQYLTSYYDKEKYDLCIKNNIDLDLNKNLIDQKLMNTLKPDNFITNCWTVNDYAEAKKLENLGVDYITSDKIAK